MNTHTHNESGIDRRTFVKTAALASAGLALGSTLASAATSAPAVLGAKRKRYALIGCGARHGMYIDAILGKYKEHAELVGLCDANRGRVELTRARAEKAGVRVKSYSPPEGANPPVPDFDRIIPEFETMIRETKPDAVIITTTDCSHDRYMVRAMELGCDVITEKPMTTDAAKCQRIFDTQKRTGKKVRVTFNYRYSPPRTQVKDLLMNGAIGEVLSVDFHWLLNTIHGADYFRRWHGNKKNSGGLMIHKATHHFDLANWWLSAMPVEVSAVGKRDFYTPEMAKRLGLKSHHERCHTCPESAKCTFFKSLAKNSSLKSRYLDNERYDGYFRDQCVFNPRIDIEDTMNVIVKYDTGATMSYSLNAFNSWEGYHIAFNGTKGRLEHTIVESIYTSGVGGDAEQGAIKSGGVITRTIPLRGAPVKHEPWSGKGGHGGGDTVMLDDIFLPEPPADKYKRNSDQRGGAASILVGAAANLCFATGKTVKLADMVSGLQRPDFPAMPGRTDAVPMP